MKNLILIAVIASSLLINNVKASVKTGEDAYYCVKVHYPVIINRIKKSVNLFNFKPRIYEQKRYENIQEIICDIQNTKELTQVINYFYESYNDSLTKKYQKTRRGFPQKKSTSYRVISVLNSYGEIILECCVDTKLQDCLNQILNE